MMGKVVGIGLVGLTQIVAWAVLGVGVMFLLGSIFAGSVDQQAMLEQSQQMQGAMQQMPNGGVSPSGMAIGDFAIPVINVTR